MRVFQTRDVVRATPRTRIIRLDLDGARFPFTAGQAVVIGLHGSPLRRPYSIASSPRQAADSQTLELLVQIDEIDASDPHLERAASGALVDVDGPFGTFGLPPDALGHDILFVAGGTGIAPLRSMLWDIFDRGARSRIALIYSARSIDEFAYEQELGQLAAEGRLELRLTVTRENAGGWRGTRGRIDAAMIQSVVRTPDTRCVLCGPPAMIDEVTRLLGAAGVSPRQIVTDTFQT